MAECDNRYFVKEKGFRNNKYGIIVTKVENAGTKDEKRTESFTPIETSEEKRYEEKK